MNKSVLNEGISTIDAVVKMAEGNPGATTVLMQLLTDDSINGALAIYWLDELEIRGWRIWFAFKDCCQQDLHKLYKSIISQDKEMINKINEHIKLFG